MGHACAGPMGQNEAREGLFRRLPERRYPGDVQDLDLQRCRLHLALKARRGVRGTGASLSKVAPAPPSRYRLVREGGARREPPCLGGERGARRTTVLISIQVGA